MREGVGGWEFETVFADESTFRTCTTYRRRVWRDKRDKRDHSLKVQYVRGCGWVSVGVFGGMCGDELL
jgi:hypothetical protein